MANENCMKEICNRRFAEIVNEIFQHHPARSAFGFRRDCSFNILEYSQRVDERAPLLLYIQENNEFLPYLTKLEYGREDQMLGFGTWDSMQFLLRNYVPNIVLPDNSLGYLTRTRSLLRSNRRTATRTDNWFGRWDQSLTAVNLHLDAQHVSTWRAYGPYFYEQPNTAPTPEPQPQFVSYAELIEQRVLGINPTSRNDGEVRNESQTRQPLR
jgi:hypothetical protein